MMEDIGHNLEESMEKTIESLKRQLTRVRTGQASPTLLEGIRVDYYGTPSPIAQVAQVSTPEARLLQIRPFDKSMIAPIEKAILSANLGPTPSNDGTMIRIPFPALTEEKIKEKAREIKKIGEDAKVAIRNDRRHQNDEIKKSEKDKEMSEDESKKLQGEVQTITDKFTARVDEIVAQKEQELFSL